MSNNIIDREEVKKLKARREKLKHQAAKLENDHFRVAETLLSVLRDFTKANPELYDKWFEVKRPDRDIRVSFSKNKDAYRVEFLAWAGDSLEDYVYLVPQLLLDDPIAYKGYRKRYLEDINSRAA